MKWEMADRNVRPTKNGKASLILAVKRVMRVGLWLAGWEMGKIFLLAMGSFTYIITAWRCASGCGREKTGSNPFIGLNG